MLALAAAHAECPDETKAAREIQPFYLYPLWFCVLRPRLPDPGRILSEGRRQTDGFPSDPPKPELSGSMSDPYVLIECEAFVVWSAPQLPPPLSFPRRLKTERWRSDFQNRLG